MSTKLAENKETALHVSQSASAEAEVEWRVQNARRIDLIYKKRDHGLTDEEQAEFEHLQVAADHYVNRRWTLDFDELAELEAAARQIA